MNLQHENIMEESLACIGKENIALMYVQHTNYTECTLTNQIQVDEILIASCKDVLGDGFIKKMMIRLKSLPCTPDFLCAQFSGKQVTKESR